MIYASLVFVFILAILGTFFKGVKEDEKGNPIHGKFGLRIPTLPGKLILTFLTLSFIVSLVSTWKSSQEAEENKQKAEVTQARLENQLAGVTDQNSTLQTSLTEVIEQNTDLLTKLENSTGINIEGFKEILKEQDNKHKENLETLSSLILRQEQIGHMAEKEFNRVRNPLPSQVYVSFNMTIPVDQEVVRSYVRRIKEKRANELVYEAYHRYSKSNDEFKPPFEAKIDFESEIITTPYSMDDRRLKSFHIEKDYMPNEHDMKEWAIDTFIKNPNLEIYFFINPIDPADHSKATYRFDSDLAINIDVPKRMMIAYDGYKKEIYFSGINWIAKFGNNKGTIASLVDFVGATVAVSQLNLYNVKYRLMSVSISTENNRRLLIKGFKSVSSDVRYPVFITSVPKNAEWK